MATTEAPAQDQSQSEATKRPENPLHRLTEEQIEQLGKEFDAIHEQVFNDLGERDAKYIRGIISVHRRLAAMGRAVLVAARFKPAWALGTTALSAAKILENMEIGHNVLHGQWDWMNDPEINSNAWDWDTASTSQSWKHSHNYIHHTYTNILGKDKDLGYEIMRIDPQQAWNPIYLFQPLYNILLMALFEWGVALHDLDLEAIRKGEKPKEKVLEDLKGIAGKARLQITKDYIVWPAISAAANVLVDRSSFWSTFKATAKANAVSNIVRNVWAHGIIFCGHFPDQTYTFTQEETEDESRGAWYVRQLIGAANIDGGPFFHVMSGNLGYQVEHHLYPDMPSSRYSEIAPRVKDICERYELPYNHGPLRRQWWTVHRTIARLAFPGGEPRPKPGPYHRNGQPDTISNRLRGLLGRA